MHFGSDQNTGDDVGEHDKDCASNGMLVTSGLLYGVSVLIPASGEVSGFGYWNSVVLLRL